MDADLESEMHALGFASSSSRDGWTSVLDQAIIYEHVRGGYTLSTYIRGEWRRTRGFPTPLAAAVAYKLLKPSLL